MVAGCTTRAKTSRFGQSRVIHTIRARSLPRSRRALRRSPQGNIELMTQKEVLNFKRASRLEQIRDKCPKQVDDRKHRIDDALILGHRANLGWIEFSGMTGVGRH